jgi:hypothetical protein
MTRFVSATLLAFLLALFAGPAPADNPTVPAPGSSPDNPLPAWGVAVGSTFNYAGDVADTYITILNYGWSDGLPGVEIWDAYGRRSFFVFADGQEYRQTYSKPGRLGDFGFSVTWSPDSNTICIQRRPSDLFVGWTTTYYGPIPLWEIPF